MGVRRFLENSTACQKSMPNLSSFVGVRCRCLLFGVGAGVVFLRAVPLVEMDGLFTRRFVDAKIRPSLCGGCFFCGVRLPVLHVVWCGWLGLYINGEFDPGSGRTLAACLTHASRTVNPFGGDQWRTGE